MLINLVRRLGLIELVEQGQRKMLLVFQDHGKPLCSLHCRVVFGGGLSSTLHITCQGFELG
jgi:hypothetical protein